MITGMVTPELCQIIKENLQSGFLHIIALWHGFGQNWDITFCGMNWDKKSVLNIFKKYILYQLEHKD